MPRVTINVGDYSGVTPAVGFSSYSGPTPPKGLYRCKTGLFRIVDNSNNDPMFKIVFEIAEPKGDKSKYNGYAIWHNANITEKGAPYLNAMLDALGLDRKAVWAGANGGIVTKKDKPEDVLKIGSKKVEGIEVLVTAKRKNYPVGSDQWELAVSSFAKAGPVSDADDDEDEADLDDDGSDESDADDDDDDDEDDDSF